MEIERISEKAIVIRSHKPIFTLGDEDAMVVTHNKAKGFNITFAKKGA